MLNRKSCTRPVVLILLFQFVLSTTLNAHFLWITIEPGEESRRVNVLFEHALKIEDGHYIPHFIRRGKTWIHNKKGTRELPVKDTKAEEKRWLSATIQQAAPLSIESYGLFGVYRYGKMDVQLHYYAKNLEVDSIPALKAISHSEKLDLDIVPTQSENGEVTLKVLWKGEPATDRKLTVRGPTKLDLQTDANGKVTFKPARKGLHSFLTSVEDETPGTDPVDKKDYVKVRHQSTLVMKLPVE